jgi:trimethylamine:corrinoid methyltransferase-like protein
MVLRLAQGIEPREDFPSLPRFEELLTEGHLLISKHTRKHLKQEIHFPGPTIDRANRSRWQEEGSRTLLERSHHEVEKMVSRYAPSRLPQEKKADLTRRMAAEARAFGMDALPEREA